MRDRSHNTAPERARYQARFTLMTLRFPLSTARSTGSPVRRTLTPPVIQSRLAIGHCQ